jgi:hypothetical protein
LAKKRKVELVPTGVVVRLAGLDREEAWNEAMRLVPGSAPVQRNVNTYSTISLENAIRQGTVEALKPSNGIDGYALITPVSLGIAMVNATTSYDESVKLGVVLAGKVRTLPVLNKLPTV